MSFQSVDRDNPNWCKSADDNEDQIITSAFPIDKYKQSCPSALSNG